MDDRSRRVRSSFLATVGVLARVVRSKLVAAFFVITMGVLAGPPRAYCSVACKPVITIKAVHISDVQEMSRVWTAILTVDASHCATSFGRFEIDFMRLKEHAPDMQFTEQFDWKPGEIKVSIDLWWDEYVQDYRIGFIAPCVCRELQF